MTRRDEAIQAASVLFAENRARGREKKQTLDESAKLLESEKGKNVRVALSYSNSKCLATAIKRYIKTVRSLFHHTLASLTVLQQCISNSERGGEVSQL